MITAVCCPQCQQDFTPGYETQVFCSRKCSNSFHSGPRPRETKTCPTCGKQWLAKRATDRQLYCSVHCGRWSPKRSGGRAAGHVREKNITRTCVVCLKDFLTAGAKALYCGKECRRLKINSETREYRARVSPKSIAAAEWRQLRDNKLAAQAGRCAICASPVALPALDHNHETGQIRGVLCHSCNLAIGLLRDSSGVAQAAADYLKEWESCVVS